MENIEDGKLVRHTRPRKDENIDHEADLLRAAGVSRVWVTPKIPFIVPITASLIFTAIVGNLLFLSGIGPRVRGSETIPGVTLGPDGEVLDHDIEAQCRAVFDNVR